MLKPFQAIFSYLSAISPMIQPLLLVGLLFPPHQLGPNILAVLRVLVPVIVPQGGQEEVQAASSEPTHGPGGT